MGLGDWMVVIALAVMAYVMARPWLRGNVAAHGEAHARQQLVAWQGEANDSGLLSALAKLSKAANAMDGLRPFEGFLSGRVSNGFVPCWTDDDYLYRIELRGQRSLAAFPARPGFGGLHAFALSGERISSSRIVEGTESPQIRRAEALARQRLRALGKLARDAGLAASLARFARRSHERWPSVSLAQVDLDGAPKPPNDATAARLAVELGQSFFGACALIHDDKGRLVVELYAWPNKAATDGFAALRWTSSTGAQFSRNLVERYEGLRDYPLPGAGVRRPGAEIQHHGYTGLDGNRWIGFAAPGS